MFRVAPSLEMKKLGAIFRSPTFRGVSRGKRKETEDDGVPCILEADKSSKEYRKNWARLIQKSG